MYIVTVYQGNYQGENHTPFIFTDKLAAYKQWAKILICMALDFGVIDSLYLVTLNSIKDFTDSNEIKILLKDILEGKENIYMVKNGYTICYGEYKTTVQVFEGEIK